MWKANRELYKFLHKRVTVKPKATSVMTRSPGEGFKLYRVVNKKLDPHNAISEHTILSDVWKLAFMKCKDLAETRSRVVQLMHLCNEFCDKTGKFMLKRTGRKGLEGAEGCRHDQRDEQRKRWRLTLSWH